MNAVATLFDWLSTKALPLWSTRGVDYQQGGFIERIEPDGKLIGDVRRARLVARQIYAFRTASELGWSGPGLELARHGLAALIANHISDDDVAIPHHFPATGKSGGGFDLYDQAFVLFGLANAARVEPDAGLEARALRILSHMREGWGHPDGGFAQSTPPTAPLKANPHMHLLEAALSWSAISERGPWTDLAAEIVALCLGKFLSPNTGALHEFFDVAWRIDGRPERDVVEPGHQSEWAWLLLRWGLSTNNSARILCVARRLFDIAEREGCNATQHRLVNELDAKLDLKWGHMRLWPQTERIKALVLFAETTTSPTERADFEHRLAGAVSALLAYFNHPIAGSWWEHMAPDGHPIAEPARASSLYHIMGAVAELSRFTGARLA
ncbi:MAG: AGE family epimerase/isomerase [Pseudomonadales bacterium]|jgi:mannose-6-phosphate isomerase|nr:AGE family epimerase/isomerase [Pseudomonadales bacterium]